MDPEALPPPGLCNLCGAALIATGPAPRCGACGSSAAIRARRRLFQGLPIGELAWRFAPLAVDDPGIDPRWFAACDSGDAPDFIALVLPPAAGDEWDRLIGQALARLSATGVLYVSHAWPDDGAPAGALQDGLRRLAASAAGHAWLACELQDPGSAQALPAWLACRDGATLARWRHWLQGWNRQARIWSLPDGAAQPEYGDDGPFAPLCAELARWQVGDKDCTLWWRDDDLVADSPALHRLAGLSARYGAPVLMAVIPAMADAMLAESTAAMATLCFCQHGWAHVSHEPSNHSKSEFGPARPLAKALDDIARGSTRLADCFGARFLPVFVPPWNAITPALAAQLPALGLRGLSRYVGLERPPVAGLRRIDTHVDVVDWGAGPGARDAADLVERIVAMLTLRRTGALGDPVGILTHHRAMVEGSWVFLERLLAVCERFPCVQWADPRELFAPAGDPRCAV